MLIENVINTKRFNKNYLQPWLRMVYIDMKVINKITNNNYLKITGNK